MRVQHRHIIYIQGYDPRGLAQYYRMFRTELRKFGRLYGLSATLGRPQAAPDGEIASWSIETKADDWQTHTNYDFLRFEDFIQRDLAQPIWRTVLQAVWIYWRLVFAGTIARFWRANWRFATFITYPHFLLLLEAIGAAGLAYGFEKGLDWLGIPDLFSIAAGSRCSSPCSVPCSNTPKTRPTCSMCCRTGLYLAILAPRPSRMGPAHRPLCAAPGQDRARERRRGNRRRRPQFGIVSRYRNAGARAAARPRSRTPRPADRAARRSAAISRSSVFTACRSRSATICGCWRSSPRSTGSTASRART